MKDIDDQDLAAHLEGDLKDDHFGDAHIREVSDDSLDIEDDLQKLEQYDESSLSGSGVAMAEIADNFISTDGDKEIDIDEDEIVVDSSP